MKRFRFEFVLISLLVIGAAPAMAGKLGSALSVDQLFSLSSSQSSNKRIFNSVVTDASFGNVIGEYDRAFSAADSHSVWGTGYNRHLGSKDPGESGRRPITLFAGLGTFQDSDDEEDDEVFSVGVSGGAGEGGVWGVTLLTADDSSDFSSGGSSNNNDDTFTQIGLNYGRFVSDGKAYLGGKLCWAESDDSFDSEFSWQGFEASLLNLDLAAKLIQDDGYLTFGLGYGTADIDQTFSNTFLLEQYLLERTGYNLSVRYTNYWSDREDYEWEVEGRLDMHDIEVDDPLVSTELGGGTDIDSIVITGDDNTIDTYSLRGTLLQRIGKDVDLYYTAMVSSSEFDGMLAWENRTDDTVNFTETDMLTDESLNFSFNLSGRYFFPNGKTSILAGYRWNRSDNERLDRSTFDGSPSTEQVNDNLFQDGDYAVALSHVLNERFRFDAGFADQGNTELFGQGPVIDADEFRFSLVGTF